MSREIRRVPANWQHPKIIRTVVYQNQGITEEYRSMNQGSFKDAVNEFHERIEEWMKGYHLWQQGFYEDYAGKRFTKEEKMKEWKDHIIAERKSKRFTNDYCAEELRKYETGICSWEDVGGEPPRYPNPDDYMPQGDWWQVFQTVSEGTPITPPFASAEELIDWMAKNKDFWGTQWTREGAEQLVKDGSAFSLIAQNENGEVRVYQPHEQHLAA